MSSDAFDSFTNLGFKYTGIKYLFPLKGMPGCGTKKGLFAMLWGLGKRQNSVSRSVIIREAAKQWGTAGV